MLDQVTVLANYKLFNPEALKDLGCSEQITGSTDLHSIECQLARSGASFGLDKPFSSYKGLENILQEYFLTSTREKKVFSVSSPLLKVSASLQNFHLSTFKIEHNENGKRSLVAYTYNQESEDIKVKVEDWSSKDLDGSVLKVKEFDIKTYSDENSFQTITEVSVGDQKCYFPMSNIKKIDSYLAGLDPLSDPECMSADSLKAHLNDEKQRWESVKAQQKQSELMQLGIQVILIATGVFCLTCIFKALKHKTQAAFIARRRPFLPL